ncbi:MAG: phosphoesterase [Clostridia bacterium]|nr:phosphoesterase [Clostridia bacterium]MBR7136314.1 phosphoesterase [Clostridia bacterium]
MKVRYDFHIHSGLSPCADKDMTPCNIVGFAAVSGLDMVAIADHNAIGNVKVAMAVGKAYGVTVVPAFELQTSEDIHVLCLFRTFEDLERFYATVSFYDVKNRPEIFGNQYFYDEDDNVVGEEERLLLNGSMISSAEVSALVKAFDGAAIPAHIDRDANGIIAILGDVTDEFTAVELSLTATEAQIAEYSSKYRVIIDSDAHTLDGISDGRVLELEDNTPSALIDYLNGK